MSGTLLAGLVISNAFKSENVYKVVTPRKPISYYDVDELIQDNFTVHSRIQSFFNVAYFFPKCRPLIRTKKFKHRFDMCRDGSFWLNGYPELDASDRLANISPDSKKLHRIPKCIPRPSI